MRIPEVSDVCLTMLMLQIDVLAFLEKAVSSHLEVTRTFGKVEVAGEVKLRLDCCRDTLTHWGPKRHANVKVTTRFIS